MSAASMPRDVALAPAVSADGATAALATGEILLLPAELWAAIDQALEAAGAIDDPAAARTAFAGAFAQALHRAGLLLIKAADPASTQAVSVRTYSLALAGKHVVEAKLEAARRFVMGWGPEACREALVDEFALGVLAIAGRAPPADRRRLQLGFLRLRALLAILAGSPTAGWDLNQAPALPEGLERLFKGEIA